MMKQFKLKKLALALTQAGLVTLTSNIAFANPQDGNVVAGNVNIQQESATKLGITQTSNKAIVDWRSFSIAPNEHTQFYMPSASSVILNRVVGQDPSAILGRMSANGQVFLVNPNGIYFGKNAQIDVAGLVATTHNIKNADFLAGHYNFNLPGKSGAAVINEGMIRIADTGIAAFVAPSVVNDGVIAAKLGKVELAAANGFTLDFYGDNLLAFMVDDKLAQTAFDREGKPLTSFVENSGRIAAEGGYVLLTAKGAENAVHSVINQSGVIEATTVGTHKGEIILQAGMGDLAVSGELNASAPKGGDGGFIDTSGKHVTIDPNTKISTAAPLGATGQWLLDPINYTIAASGGDITGTDLASRLLFNNIEIKTGASGFYQGDIFVNDEINWTGLTKLTLTAHHDINVNAPVFTNGGSVKLRTDSEGSGLGTVNFFGTGHITATNGGSVGIYYNPTSYTDEGTRSDSTHSPYALDVTAEAGRATAFMLVNDVNHLQDMNTNLSGNYALGKDIDASATTGWNSGAGFLQVGHQDNPFSGVLNGLGHTVKNLYINRPNDNEVGLIGTLTQGTVKNISVSNVSVTGNSLVGGLIGAMRWGSTLNNAYSTGNVEGTSAVGGLVGGATPYFYPSNGYSYCTDCILIDGGASSATVYGNSSVGGLIGFTDQTRIRNSYATGSVNGVTIGSQPSLSIGGFIGNFFNSIELSNSYSAGLVSSTGQLAVGGFAGASNSYIAPSTFYDTQKSDIPNSVGGTGKTTAEMQQQATFDGWDFINTWYMPANGGYPLLRAFMPVASSSVILTPTPTTDLNAASDTELTPTQSQIQRNSDYYSQFIPPYLLTTAGSINQHYTDPNEQVRRNSDYYNELMLSSNSESVKVDVEQPPKLSVDANLDEYSKVAGLNIFTAYYANALGAVNENLKRLHTTLVEARTVEIDNFIQAICEIDLCITQNTLDTLNTNDPNALISMVDNVSEKLPHRGINEIRQFTNIIDKTFEVANLFILGKDLFELAGLAEDTLASTIENVKEFKGGLDKFDKSLVDSLNEINSEFGSWYGQDMEQEAIRILKNHNFNSSLAKEIASKLKNISPRDAKKAYDAVGTIKDAYTVVASMLQVQEDAENYAEFLNVGEVRDIEKMAVQEYLISQLGDRVSNQNLYTVTKHDGWFNDSYSLITLSP